MAQRNYYQILGITRDASDKEIKRAYRELARRYHPDLNPGDEEAENRFKEINEAYEVLSDPDKRSRYDQMGPFWQRSSGGNGFNWTRWSSTPSNTDHRNRNWHMPYEEANGSGGIFSDFLGTLFGDTSSRARNDSRARKKPIHGSDLEVDINITLEEAYEGTIRKITSSETGRDFNAQIPRGARSGTKVRFAAQGKRGFAGGERGDLYVIIHVEPHHLFERNGDDLHMDLRLDLYTAVLGGDVRIPTLGGDVMLRIRSGTQSGQLIRLSQKGMPRLHNTSEYGDLYVRPLIQVPTELNERELDLFKQLRNLRS
ncbi:MAG: J domain-containing protein [Chloroflexi bacterium]|nr:J domain-containing protein [Chloroflexota bacterium]